MTGSVTISLEDYEELKSKNSNSIELKNKVLKASKEIEIFLSFLCTRENIDDHIKEFNSYSKTCKIHILDGKAKIELNQINEDENS
jgi:hypothetical protein